jgi:hypothetical protein
MIGRFPLAFVLCLCISATPRAAPAAPERPLVIVGAGDRFIALGGDRLVDEETALATAIIAAPERFSELAARASAADRAAALRTLARLVTAGEGARTQAQHVLARFIGGDVATRIAAEEVLDYYEELGRLGAPGRRALRAAMAREAMRLAGLKPHLALIRRDDRTGEGTCVFSMQAPRGGVVFLFDLARARRGAVPLRRIAAASSAEVSAEELIRQVGTASVMRSTELPEDIDLPVRDTDATVYTLSWRPAAEAPPESVRGHGTRGVFALEMHIGMWARAGARIDDAGPALIQALTQEFEAAGFFRNFHEPSWIPRPDFAPPPGLPGQFEALRADAPQ